MSESQADNRQLDQFFAVSTSGSLWRVDQQSREPLGSPAVERLDEQNKVTMRLENWSSVGITLKLGVMLYHSSSSRGRQPPEKLNDYFWGGGSSPLVGLFLEEEVARACLLETDLQQWDPRWLEDSIAVIDAIGQDHPVFVLGLDLESTLKRSLAEVAI